MSRSSEDVLLQVPHVKFKKYEGILFVMSERIGWMPGSKSSGFSVSHKYTEIKTQKVSPVGKSKIQLQLVLHDDNSTIFQFVHPDGPEHQTAERDKVRDMLGELLKKFKRKVYKEMEEKNKVLSENPSLLQLYKDLVITQVITADEFWNNHAAEYIKQKKGFVQDVGVSGSFLADIKPQADGANGRRYNLTPDIIESIFKTYPAVKKRYLENVPSKLSEQEFWTKFFQSHYFHRDRIHAQGTSDIFTDCARDDEKFIRKKLKRGIKESLADLQGFTDNNIAEVYGVGEDRLQTPSQNIVHQSIVKRFNQHSVMVMETITQQQQQPVDPATSQTTQPGEPSKETPVVVEENSKKRVLEKTHYEDLEDPPPKKPAELNLSRLERYFTGPTPADSQNYLTQDELLNSRANLQEELKTWSRFGQRNQTILTSANAVAVLGELNPGGSMMVGRHDAVTEQCPASIQIELRQLYSSLRQLIRPFWASFPPNTPDLKEKATKGFETLQKFQASKVRPFEKDLERRYSAGGGLITQHLNSMLDAAYKKYNSWANKKSR